MVIVWTVAAIYALITIALCVEIGRRPEVDAIAARAPSPAFAQAILFLMILTWPYWLWRRRVSSR